MRQRTIQSVRFGELVFRSEDIIHFDKGPLGFERFTRFLLLEGEDTAPLKFFQSLDDPNISFPLLRPHAVCPDYQFELPEHRRRDLELDQPEDAAVFCVVTIADSPTESTINLFAPVVINLLQKKASQVILVGSRYQVTAPLLEM